MEELSTVVATLWPSNEVTVSRRRISRRRGRVFQVFPSVRHPMFLLPPSPAAAVALSPPYGGRDRLLMRLLARLHARGLLGLVPLPRLVISTVSDEPDISDVLAAVLGSDGRVGDLVVRLGRHRYNRAIVVWVLDDHGVPIAVVKTSKSAAGRRALETEYAAVCVQTRSLLPSLRSPSPIAYLSWAGLDLLVLEPLIAAEPTKDDAVPVAQMKTLASAGEHSWMPLALTPLSADLAREIALLRDPGESAWLSEALDRLLGSWGDVAVLTGAWHGDWVSWNMTWDGDQVLIWDWEHFREAGLSGFDHVHYLAQELRMRKGTATAVEGAWLERAGAALRDDWGFDLLQRHAVIGAYLLHINVRFVRDREGDPSGFAPRVGWSRSLVERWMPSLMVGKEVG